MKTCHRLCTAALLAAAPAPFAAADLFIYDFDRPSQDFIDQNTVGPFTYDIPDGQINESAGLIMGIDATYNTSTERLTWAVTFGGQPDGSTFHHTRGFWLVLTSGDLPITLGGETAQLFFDASGASPVLTGYAYNGTGSHTSFFDGMANGGIQPPDPIFSSLNDSSGFVFDLAVTDNPDGTTTFSLDVDAAQINDHIPMHGPPADWRGSEFADLIGIWMHPVTNLNTGYDGSGLLTDWNFARHGWFDAVFQQTIPAPSALLALALGACAPRRRRR